MNQRGFASRAASVALAAMLMGVGATAQASVLYLLDFDGTITDDQSPRSTWRTRWILPRIDRLRSLLQDNPATLALPDTIELSYREYRQLVGKLGKGDEKINSPQPVQLEPDPLFPDRPLEIVPGYYAVDDHISFKYYRPSRRRGHSYLVNDLEEAEQRTILLNQEAERKLGRKLTADETFSWKGPAFPLVQKALSQPETVSDLVVMTARWHADWEFRKFLRKLRDYGLVENVSGINRDGRRVMPRFHSLNEPESLQFGRYGMGPKKANVVRAEAAQRLNSRREFHEELSPDPLEASRGIKRKVHTVIVAEDDPRFLDSIRKALEALSGELYFTHKMKFVLLNTASNEEELKSARWPWRWTVFHLGFGRPATTDEIAMWTGEDCAQHLQ